MRATCQVADCTEPIVGQGLCRKHYMRQRRKGSTDDTRKNARATCSQEGCERPHSARGLCHDHWKAARRTERRSEFLGQLPSLTCAHCGGPVKPRHPRYGPVAYCSRKCKEQAYAASGRTAQAVRRHYYRSRYGMTEQEIAEMLTAQGGGCAICGETQPKGRHGGFHVDHEHSTGRVRGVLCHSCNVSIGHFRDDPELLRKAAAYLEGAQ